MAEQQKLNEIAELNRQIASLKEKINEADAEAKTYVEKRDKLNEQFRKIRQEIHALTDERNRLNDAVKALKQQRGESRTKIRANIEEIKTHRRKLVELKEKTPRQSYQQLQKAFTDIEWKIQTTSLDMQEEKTLIENVKQLETQLNVYKKIQRHSQRITKLQQELDSLKIKSDASHQQLAETAENSQRIHENILARIGESKTVKNDADGLHNAYLHVREKAKPLITDMKKLEEEKAGLQGTIRIEDERKRKTAEHALKEKLGAQAKEKLQRGEKLTWDEFQLLSEGDDQTQD